MVRLHVCLASYPGHVGGGKVLCLYIYTFVCWWESQFGGALTEKHMLFQGRTSKIADQYLGSDTIPSLTQMKMTTFANQSQRSLDTVS